MNFYIYLFVFVIIFIIAYNNFHPAPTQKITGNLFVIRCDFVNFYAYRTSAGVVLFDAGEIGFSAKRGLKKLEIDPSEVTHIFLTHTDYDHAGGLKAFKNAKVFLSEAEVQMIDGTTPRRLIIHNRRIKEYTALAEGETVTVGDTEIKTHIFPGHTPGSAAYLIGNRFLACGDLLYVSKKGVIAPFNVMMNMDHKQIVKSVEAADPLIKSVEYIMTGHSGYYKMPS